MALMSKESVSNNFTMTTEEKHRNTVLKYFEDMCGEW